MYIPCPLTWFVFIGILPFVSLSPTIIYKGTYLPLLVLDNSSRSLLPIVPECPATAVILSACWIPTLYERFAPKDNPVT